MKRAEIRTWARWVTGAVALSASLLAQASTGFAACPQFFANGQPPEVPKRPAQRELCYDAFAILHSGESRTPVYVAQRLNHQSVVDADEKRTTRFFADARLPRAERAELEDYKRSGFSRRHMAPAGDMPTAPGNGAELFSGQYGSSSHQAQLRCLGQDRKGHSSVTFSQHLTIENTHPAVPAPLQSVAPSAVVLCELPGLCHNPRGYH